MDSRVARDKNINNRQPHFIVEETRTDKSSETDLFNHFLLCGCK